MNQKIILIIMDSLGVGGAVDAKEFGDEGANTLLNIIKKYPQINIENLRNMGLCNIETIKEAGMEVNNPVGLFGRIAEESNGKDTITGHWEFMGINTSVPFKTYPEGFPKEFVKEFEGRINRKVIGNYPASGTQIIDELGEEHENSGSPIIYTSADSVLQIAANVDVIPLEELYKICEIAREMLVGDWACGRVIARPYKIIDETRKRTSDRKDYAVSPPKDTLLDNIEAKGLEVRAVGKIKDIFNGQGITKAIHTKNNMDGIDETILYMKDDFKGLIFTNLVDFDSEFGHRRNPVGYGKAIEEFDSRIPEIVKEMNDKDLLILTADHGNDPTYTGTDHTRENVPVIILTKKMWQEKNMGKGLGRRESFADIGATISEIFDTEKLEIGTIIEEAIKVLKS